MKIYALYKGEELLAMGTVIQIAHKLNVKIDTIQFYMTPTYKRRCKNSLKRRTLIEVE